MDLKKIRQLITENAPKASFSAQRAQWLKQTPLREKSISFLEPHGGDYYSSICPFFSFEFEDKSVLDYFSLVSLRDGFYPLVRFFQLNPEPTKSQCHYVIDEKLASLVPRAWQEKIILRRLKANTPRKKNKTLLLVVHGDQLSSPIEMLREQLSTFFLQRKNEFQEVMVFAYYPVQLGEEGVSNYLSIGEKTAAALTKIFIENNLDFKFCHWLEAQFLDVEHMTYYFFNPLNFYITDSYLDHYFLQRGAQLETPAVTTIDSHFIPVSHNHGFELFYDQKYFKHEIRFPDGAIELPIYKRTDSDQFENVFLTNKNFKHWAHDEALKLDGGRK